MANRRRKKRKGRKSNVIQFNNVIRINYAVVLFVVIFIYVAISAFISMSKETISIYEVRESDINNNSIAVGVALRKESVIKTHKSGYVCYFAREGEKVGSGYGVCAIDETGDIINSISISGENSKELSDEDYASIRNLISQYKTQYKNEEFFEVYNFKSNIEDKVFEIGSDILNDTIENETSTVKATLEEISTSDSGIIIYSTDGYENTTVSTINDKSFDKSDYEKISLKTGDIISSDSPVFKIVTDENWSVVCQIDDSTKDRIKDLEYITFALNGSDEMYVSNYTIEKRDNKNYLIMNLNKYMIDFINDRFLNVEIILDRFEGLKVPKTSIAVKEVYTIDKKFIIDANGSYSLKVQSRDESGNIQTVNRDIKVYKVVDDVYYVDPEDLEETDTLVSTDDKDTIGVSLVQTGNIEGVYIVNQGVADFNMINILKDGEEFVIVEKEKGLREFDKIVMNADKVTENQIVY